MILIKSNREIDYIRESCKIVAETLQLVKRYVKVGVTTKELDKIAEDYIEAIMLVPHSKDILKRVRSIFQAQFVLQLMMRLFTVFPAT